MIVEYGVTNPTVPSGIGGIQPTYLVQHTELTLSTGQIAMILEALAVGNPAVNVNGFATVVAGYNNDGATLTIGYDTERKVFYTTLYKT